MNHTTVIAIIIAIGLCVLFGLSFWWAYPLTFCTEIILNITYLFYEPQKTFNHITQE